MSRSRKVKTKHLSIRLQPELAQVVADLAKHTGWSGSRAVNCLAMMGWQHFAGKDTATRRDQLQQALHEGELTRRHTEELKRLRATGKLSPPA